MSGDKNMFFFNRSPIKYITVSNIFEFIESSSSTWDALYSKAFLPMNAEAMSLKAKVDALYDKDPEYLKFFYPHTAALVEKCSCSNCLLELGCGTGIYSYVCSKFLPQDVKIVLLDHSDVALNIARKVFKHRPNTIYVKADIFDLPFSKGSFDIVITGGLIEHFELNKQKMLIGSLQEISTYQIHQYPVSNLVYWSLRSVISAMNGFRWPFGYEVPLSSSRESLLFPTYVGIYNSSFTNRLLFRMFNANDLHTRYKDLICRNHWNHLYFDKVVVIK